MSNQSEAFLRQARSDYHTLRLLIEAGAEGCHVLHYVQMASEKVAKAARLRIEQHGAAQPTHRVVAKFLSALRTRQVRDAFGMREAAFGEYLRSVKRVLVAVEDLTPALASAGPNLEYPWKASETKWVAPADHCFETLLTHAEHMRILKFLNRILVDFDTLF